MTTTSSRSSEEAPLYTYSLSDEASRSHAYFWSGVSKGQPGQKKKSLALHRSEEVGLVRLGLDTDTVEDRQSDTAWTTTNILSELRTSLLNFQRQSKLLTKIFLCKISNTFEFCRKI